jgi:hypothetical protein
VSTSGTIAHQIVPATGASGDAKASSVEGHGMDVGVTVVPSRVTISTASTSDDAVTKAIVA